MRVTKEKRSINECTIHECVVRKYDTFYMIKRNFSHITQGYIINEDIRGQEAKGRLYNGHVISI